MSGVGKEEKKQHSNCSSCFHRRKQRRPKLSSKNSTEASRCEVQRGEKSTRPSPVSPSQCVEVKTTKSSSPKQFLNVPWACELRPNRMYTRNHWWEIRERDSDSTFLMKHQKRRLLSRLIKMCVKLFTVTEYDSIVSDLDTAERLSRDRIERTYTESH